MYCITKQAFTVIEVIILPLKSNGLPFCECNHWDFFWGGDCCCFVLLFFLQNDLNKKILKKYYFSNLGYK